MVVASGIVKVNRVSNVASIARELKKRGMEVDDIETEHVLFIIRRATLDHVKTEIESIKQIADVRNVHVTYYSLEGTDKGPEWEVSERKEGQQKSP